MIVHINETILEPSSSGVPTSVPSLDPTSVPSVDPSSLPVVDERKTTSTNK